MTLALASTSPRRRELLESAGVPFKVVAPPEDAERLPRKGESPEAYALRAAKGKASATAKLPDAKGLWVLGSDTVVAAGSAILGKPASRPDAERMLRLLSRKTHRVLSAFAIVSPQGKIAHHQCVATEVDFVAPSEAQLARYLDTGEPMDKAGAYGIQGHGAFLVRAIRGSYTNVVGLPLAEVLEALTQLGVIGDG